MKFLADQDVWASTVRFLSGLGHDVVTAGQLRLANAQDTELLRVTQELGRIFVTRDAGEVEKQTEGFRLIRLLHIRRVVDSISSER
jgi:predicted nuclease of predicted toxin-antitoxin system